MRPVNRCEDKEHVDDVSCVPQEGECNKVACEEEGWQEGIDQCV